MKQWTTEMWDEWQGYLDHSKVETMLVDEIIMEANAFDRETKTFKRDYRLAKKEIRAHLREAKRWNKKAEQMSKLYERYMNHENPRHVRR